MGYLFINIAIIKSEKKKLYIYIIKKRSELYK